jgi:hypothetical protein
MTESSKRTTYYQLALVLILVASCFRVFICFVHNPMDYLVSDMLRHWNNGRAFPRGGYLGAADPIVYQIYIFVLQRMAGSNRVLVALASSILSVLMPWTYYRAARDFGIQKTQALWVWALIAWTPSLAVIYHFIMMETVLLFLEGVALWMTARYLREGGTPAFLWFVFFWTAACLTKPTVIPLAGVCFLWVWWKRSTSLRQIALGAGLAFVMLIPQAFRSKVALGFVAPFGNPWLTRIQLRSGVRMIHFYYYAPSNRFVHLNPEAGHLDFIFGSPSAYIRPLEPLSHWVMRRAIGDTTALVTINGGNGEQDWKAAYKRFGRDSDEWLAQWRENVILFLFAPSWPESGFWQWDSYLEYLCRWMWAPLILVVFILNGREFAHRRFDLIPIATMLFTLALGLQNVVITEGRYRKPVEPLLLLNLVWVLNDKSSRFRAGDPSAQEAASQAAV